MITARNLHKSFGKLKVLSGVSLEVKEGEVAVLVGPSGSGKSTFLRCLNGLEAVDSGEIIIDGIRLGSVLGRRPRLPAIQGRPGGLPPTSAVAKIRSETGMVFQNYNLFPHLNVLRNLILAQKVVRGRSEIEAREIGLGYLEKVGLSEKANSLPAELSGGQAQRVAIARALCMMPKIMLFDEPTSALDPVMTAEVLSVIRRLAEEGMTMIVISHEINFARDVASQMSFMHEGQIIETAPPSKFLSSPENEIVKNFLTSARSGE